MAAGLLLVCAFVLWKADPGNREWAAKRGYEFTRTDESLAEEWTRGAASKGAVPKEVVSGVVDGHEMYLAELGGTKVVAMRRAQASDIVLDFRTFDSDSDLLPVRTVGEFELFSNDVTVAERAVDSRMENALSALRVDAVWAESDWVLAQYSDTEPEQIFHPLSLFADAATVLPPRTITPLQLLDPSRAMVPNREIAERELEEPTRLTRTEPVDMPVRAVPKALGVVEPRPVGVDDVDPIAEGPARLPESDGTRIVRRDDGSTIF